MPVEGTELRRLGIDAAAAGSVDTLVRARGCAKCNGSGYRGRTGIYEVLPMSESLRALIHARAAEAEMRAAARQSGMATLREEGMRWVAMGATTFEELLRATSE